MPRVMFLALVIFFMIAVGCVGTIEDTETRTTKAVPAVIPSIGFTGISEAKGIAGDKIRISFFPAEILFFSMGGLNEKRELFFFFAPKALRFKPF